MVVAFAIAVDDVQSLASMGVKEMELVRTIRNSLQLCLGVGTGCQPAGEDTWQEEDIGKISWRPVQGKKPPEIDWPPRKTACICIVPSTNGLPTPRFA